MKIVVKESIIDACERIRKEAEKIVYDYDNDLYRYRPSETIDIPHIEVKSNDQKLIEERNDLTKVNV